MRSDVYLARVSDPTWRLTIGPESLGAQEDAGHVSARTLVWMHDGLLLYCLATQRKENGSELNKILSRPDDVQDLSGTENSQSRLPLEMNLFGIEAIPDSLTKVTDHHLD
jgi:hypothetical protein